MVFHWQAGITSPAIVCDHDALIILGSSYPSFFWPIWGHLRSSHISICNSSALGQHCRIIEQQFIFLPGTPSLGITDRKKVCVDYGDGINISDLPVLSFRVVTQLTTFLAGRKSALTPGTSCEGYFHTPELQDLKGYNWRSPLNICGSGGANYWEDAELWL